MVDYKIGEELSEEENLKVMMMMTKYDPISIEEAMTNKYWREPMPK